MKVRFLFATGKGPNIKHGFWRFVKAKAISIGIIGWTAFLAVGRLDFKALKYLFCHVEVWWPDENYPNYHNGFGGRDDWPSMVHRETRYNFLGECFSSTTRGDATGVRIAPANEVLKHPERWRYIECEVDEEMLYIFKNWARTQVGRKYDYWGLFGFFWPWNTQDKLKDYCSELIALAAYFLDCLLERIKRISPRRIASKLAKKWHEPKRLICK